MNIIICNHIFRDFYTSPKRLDQGILTYLAEIIQPYHAVCLDIVKNTKKNFPLPKALHYLKPYLIKDDSGYSFFHNYNQYGELNPADFEEYQQKPLLAIMITSFAYCYFDGFRETALFLKEMFPNIPIIAGGAGPSADPNYYLAHSCADYIVIGPAEISLKKLLDYLNDGNAFPDINVLAKNHLSPRIDLDLSYEFKPYLNIKKEWKTVTVILQLTRGCPKACTYCSIRLQSGKIYRKADIEKVYKLISNLSVNPHQPVHFNFEDDNISSLPDYFLYILHKIKAIYPQASFSCENGIDFNTLNTELIDQLVKYGITQWNISLTSSKDAILHQTGRSYSVCRFEEVLELLNKSDLPVIVYFISGVSGDNGLNILETLLYLAEKKVIIGISNYYPVPGTVDADKIKEPLVPLLTTAASFYPWNYLTTPERITLFVLSRFINAIKAIDADEWDNMDEFSIIPLNTKTADQFKITGKNLLQNVTRQELTMIGILISIKQKQIFTLQKHKEEIILLRYPLDSKLLKKFFEYFDTELRIKNLKGFEFNYHFWTNLIKKLIK